MARTLAILPLGRATFDTGYAAEKLDAMLTRIDALGAKVVGPRTLLFDAETTGAALDEVLVAGPAILLILQVTFTDAALTLEIARRHHGALGIWAIPEPRAGGRLRLNSFCGLNLASHALSRAGREFAWLYRDPGAPDCGSAIAGMLEGRRMADHLTGVPAQLEAGEAARQIAASLPGLRIGRIGEAPAGFDTCRYEPGNLAALAGVEVEEIALDRLFATARAGDRSAPRDALRKQIAADVDGLETVDSGQLARSLDLKLALDEIRAEDRLDAFAIRCWPEMFTEYGGAVCGPVSLSGEAGTPCACEADVYGALTQVVLQRVAAAPVFLTDLVDLDAEDDTGVVWHCGQAPSSMRAGKATATVHSNRRMPLLFEFALKPGRVTFARISQAGNRPQMVIASGQMLDRPKSFTGTSGVVRFDTPAGAMAEKIIASGLEHHMALAYGDHREMLREVAAALELPVLEL